MRGAHTAIPWKVRFAVKKDIYIIRNTENNKVYIGQTNNTGHRWSQHKCDAKRGKDYPLYRAMRDTGIERFSLAVIESDVPEHKADERENYWIKFFDSCVPNGYNVADEYRHDGYFSPEQAAEVRRAIKTTALTFKEIAKKFNVPANVISDINNGNCYRDADSVYPLRPANEMSKDKVKQIHYQLKYELSKGMKQICEEYDVDYSVLYDINNGKLHRLPGNNYPLRQDGNILKRTISEETFLKIVKLLQETEMTFDEIGKASGVSSSYVSAINMGKARIQGHDFSYPLREGTRVRIVLSPSQIADIEHKLRSTDESVASIAKRYGVASQLIRNINLGNVKKYARADCTYPLRKLKKFRID